MLGEENTRWRFSLPTGQYYLQIRRGNYGTGVNNICLEEIVEEMKKIMKKARKWEISKGTQWEVLCAKLVAGVLFLQCDFFSGGPSKTCTTQEVVDPAVLMPAGCRIAFVSNKFLPFAFEGQCLKKKLRSSQSLPPRGAMGEGL